MILFPPSATRAIYTYIYISKLYNSYMHLHKTSSIMLIWAAWQKSQEYNEYNAIAHTRVSHTTTYTMQLKGVIGILVSLLACCEKDLGSIPRAVVVFHVQAVRIHAKNGGPITRFQPKRLQHKKTISYNYELHYIHPCAHKNAVQQIIRVFLFLAGYHMIYLGSL